MMIATYSLQAKAGFVNANAGQIITFACLNSLERFYSFRTEHP
jgi:hypothetical protein